MKCAGYYTPAQIERLAYSRTPEEYLPTIESGGIYVVVMGTEVVGFGQAAPGEVVAIFVAPEVALQGIGTLLLQHSVNIARRGHRGEIQLESTLNAQGFYERFGFTEIERKIVHRGDVLFPVVRMRLPKEIDSKADGG